MRFPSSDPAVYLPRTRCARGKVAAAAAGTRSPGWGVSRITPTRQSESHPGTRGSVAIAAVAITNETSIPTCAALTAGGPSSCDAGLADATGRRNMRAASHAGASTSNMDASPALMAVEGRGAGRGCEHDDGYGGRGDHQTLRRHRRTPN